MKIDKRLNLVVPIQDDGATLYVHSMPIGREVFERYWPVISRTLNYAVGTAGGTAPRIASLALKDVAEEMGLWEDKKGPDGTVTKPGVKSGLLNEIRRLTNVVVYQDGAGWQTVPLDVAVQQGKFDADEQREVESAIVFFTLVSWGMAKADLKSIGETGFGIANAQASSLNCTEWASSLPTSTGTGSSGRKVASLVPR
jgi:hypothetical protein